MDALSYILIGILQGILEWLPVSSKGVEALIMVKFFNKTLSEALVLALWMHTGTLLAALVYYRIEILEILKNLKNYIKNPAKDSIYLGIAQGFTAIPGLSRSGTTISTLMFRGYSAREALRVSFLVSIPAVFGVEVLLGLLKTSTFDILMIPGIIASFIFGLLTINSLVKLAEKINFGYFCSGFGFIIILFVIISSLYNI
ncbi:MAG: undecaprenyl-diphosphate phosphatase [Euryarchaeota archaeon]|nr:undecaprenyl-diphosphate phosphatase [Euryarchaeota archaeon]MBU4220052.1 undecaprenyl-diphosphate phosphatase [Euryarchaeota archaeon]MCG2736591.1 undecaprenyl-diphosphate phosphatase [Candidatus Methanoperedenaceae archaeon]